MFDGRSADGRYVRHLEAELLDHLGGPDKVTTPMRLLVERACRLQVQLLAFDRKFRDGSFVPHDARTYAGLTSQYRLLLRELGLKAQPTTKTPTLADVIADIQRSKAAAR